MGMDGRTYPVTPGQYAPPPPASGKAVTALVLGIAGFLCCNLLGPVAFFLGMSERAAIRAGHSSPTGDGYALAGMILGIIGTVFLLIGLLWLFVAGGLAVIGAAGGAH